MELLLAFDIGTSSLRTSLFTIEAKRLTATTAQEEYPLLTTADGGAELEPARLKAAALACLEKTFRVLREEATLQGARIVGIGASCFWHSLVGVDHDNRPLTPVVTWADSRCIGDAETYRRAFDERETHAKTGCMSRTSFWPAKLLWLRRTDPETFAKVARWLSPAEWLQREFCGEAACAYGMATGTGLFNPSTLDWVPELLEHCDLQSSQLGNLSDKPTTATAETVARFPELKDVPWFPAIGDGAASNLGSGATKPGLAAINVGTSAALRVMSEGSDAVAPFGLFCYRVDARRYLVGGAVSNAGNLRAWCVKELQLPGDDNAIEAELLARATPEHGLMVLPFWTAERAPTWRGDLKGAVIGLTQHTSALDLLQATTEAVYYRIALIEEMVARHEGSRPKLIVSGGIQKSPASIQRLASVLNAPLYANHEAEASIRGAAVFVAEKLGRTIPPFCGAEPIPPCPQAASRYRVEREKQQQLERLIEKLQDG
ncbi:MAG TPA: gluconokinase [Chthoniobacteraceae bacterium]|nr:gluconokinase [Chthoniobacteraceae bacterium]